MKKALLSIVSCLVAARSFAAPPPATPGEKPRLVVLIAVDQLRYDYLTRFRDDFRGGFSRLLTEGAVFTNAHLEHYPTVTAVGHATMLSGATPALSGIIGNDWYDRESRGSVASISDASVQLVGAAGAGASPRRLLVSTLGDELKMAGRGSPRVIGLSLKDRSAILPAGRMADAAYWFDAKGGGFVSSTYYLSELPAWMKEFNGRRLADGYAAAEWSGSGAGAPFKRLPAGGPALYAAVYSSPFGNELLEALAEAALDAEELGRRETTDVLAVSFSSNDAVGHEFGPDSPAVRDVTLRTDGMLQKLLAAIDRRVGLARALVVLTSDHGVAPMPETMEQRRMPGGRLLTADLVGAIRAALVEAYGPGEWILGRGGSSIYLSRDLMREKRLDEGAVQRTAARAAAAVPHVLRVFTREQLLLGEVPRDPLGERVLRGFHAQRSGDLEILLEPYWMREGTGTTHGTPYSYDSHIPLVLMGPGITPGQYHRQVALNDLAPTLATMLGVETPSGSVGRVLDEVMAGSGGALRR